MQPHSHTHERCTRRVSPLCASAYALLKTIYSRLGTNVTPPPHSSSTTPYHHHPTSPPPLLTVPILPSSHKPTTYLATINNYQCLINPHNHNHITYLLGGPFVRPHSHTHQHHMQTAFLSNAGCAYDLHSNIQTPCYYWRSIT